MLSFFAKIFGKRASKRASNGRRRQLVRLWVEELTPRVLPSASPMAAVWGHCSDGAATVSADSSSAATTGEPCHHGKHGAAFAASLTNASGATGTAQFNPISGKLTVQVVGAAASSTLNVAIGGTTIGTLTTDASGNGKTTITQASGAIAAGTGITVGDLSGSFVQIEFKATLTGTSGAAGSAKYNAMKNVLHVSITGATPSTTYNVTLDSTVIGQITTNSTGAGKLKVTLASGTTFHTGSTLTVADTAGNAAILSGAFT